MKKIVILSDSFLPRWDGIARFLSEIIPPLSESYGITVVAPDFGKVDMGVPILRIPTTGLRLGDYRFPKVSLAMRHAIKEADLVFSNTIGPIGGMGIVLARWYHKPIIHFMHAVDWELTSKSVAHGKLATRILIQLFTRFLYNRANVIAVPYREAIELLRKNGVRRPEKVVIRLGVDTDKFTPVDEETKKERKKALGIDPEKTVIGFIGRVAREKGIDIITAAFADIQRDRDDIQLLIVGDGVPTMVRGLQQMRGVTYVKPRGDIVHEMQAVDIFVLASLTETTSLVTLEAMACEKIVIASSVGYVKSYIAEKENGMLFARGNATTLRIKLQAVLEHPERYRDLGPAARKTVMRRFSWKRTVEQMRELFSEF